FVARAGACGTWNRHDTRDARGARADGDARASSGMSKGRRGHSMSQHQDTVIPPPSFSRFAERFPAVVEAYDRFGAVLRAAGPLSAREVALVKLAVSVGARMQGATYAHARKARAAGIADADL